MTNQFIIYTIRYGCGCIYSIQNEESCHINHCKKHQEDLNKFHDLVNQAKIKGLL